MMGAEIGVMCLQVKDCRQPQMPRERPEMASPSQLPEGTKPAYTLISDL